MAHSTSGVSGVTSRADLCSQTAELPLWDGSFHLDFIQWTRANQHVICLHRNGLRFELPGARRCPRPGGISGDNDAQTLDGFRDVLAVSAGRVERPCWTGALPLSVEAFRDLVGLFVGMCERIDTELALVFVQGALLTVLKLQSAQAARQDAKICSDGCNVRS